MSSSFSRFLVVGRKRWAGTMQDGKAVDSAKLFVQVNLDDSRNDDKANAAGYCTEEIRLDGGHMLKPVEHLPLPFMVELELVRVSNGKTSRERVIGLKPVEAAKVVKAA